jgi:hypothetical protein
MNWYFTTVKRYFRKVTKTGLHSKYFEYSVLFLHSNPVTFLLVKTSKTSILEIFVPRSKHFPSRFKNNSEVAVCFVTHKQTNK